MSAVGRSSVANVVTNLGGTEFLRGRDGLMATSVRDELGQVIERLSDDQVPAVLAFARLVESGRVDVHVAASATRDATSAEMPFGDVEIDNDPMLRVLAALEDDEPLTADEAASVVEGLEEYRRGDYVDSVHAKRTHLG